MTSPRLSRSSLLPLSALSLALVLTSGCSGDDAPLGDGDDETDGDGDGDPTTGDGDGDPTTGDGDGDPTTGDGDGDGDGDPTGDGDGDPTDGEDTTPPTVTMTTPSADASGVLADVVIEVSFSEPMDKASVQAAWQSPDLPSNAVTFSWDTEGTILTVTPNSPLAIAEIDALEDPATAYSFSINAAATDLAGNGLEPELALSFTTARRWTTPVLRDPELTNYVSSNGAVAGNASVIRVGDSANNLGYRAFVTYAIAEFPEDMIALESARMRLLDWDIVGTPLALSGGLGNVMVHDVSFTEILSTTYNLEPIAQIGALLGFINPNVVLLDVTDHVQADLDADATYTQFRLACGTATNNNSAPDYVSIVEANLPLELTVLVP
jgi:hypothetical protein